MTITFETSDIGGISRKRVLEQLDCGDSTLGEYIYFLNELKPKDWDYEPYSTGFTLSQVQILAIFKQLIRTLGRKQAFKQINKTLENLNNAST